MQPGSLIFLVIVAVWAVYLVQHWIRRRDHLATARSVDRFSDAIRVLERRTTPMTSTTSSYAASAATGPALVGRPAPGGRRAAARTPSGPRTPPVRRPGRTAARPGVLARRIRGLVVLAALVALPLTVLLSAVSVLPWGSVPVGLAGLAVVVAWTRASVRREQAVRRAARVGERRRVRAPRQATVDAVSSPTVSPSAPAVPGVVEPDGQQQQEVEPVSAEPALYDLMAVDEAVRVAAAAAVFAQEWSPVPVPTPTYMLKDSAPRMLDWDAAPTMVPVPIEVEDDELEQLMAARHRRIVG
ncbi:hypothetical protein V3N99_06250 [Dermatophilaceae bacterium Soc4.6]